MNYRHAFHAGNFADVVKHLALVAVLRHLRRKEAGFAAIDTHGGRGEYDLRADAAARTGEAGNGIARLRGIAGDADSLLGDYLRLARAREGHYPGSPLIAARMLRPQDRLTAIEKHPGEQAALAEVLSPFRKARAEAGDGYARLAALLPPLERRGVVLIDPPFERMDEFEALAAATAQAWRRWPTGTYLIWFPVKAAADAARFCAEILNLGVDKAVRVDIDTGAGRDGREGLTRAGILVLNPPFGFDARMREALDVAAPYLGADGGAARADIAILAGTGAPATRA